MTSPEKAILACKGRRIGMVTFSVGVFVVFLAGFIIGGPLIRALTRSNDITVQNPLILPIYSKVEHYNSLFLSDIDTPSSLNSNA